MAFNRVLSSGKILLLKNRFCQNVLADSWGYGKNDWLIFCKTLTKFLNSYHFPTIVVKTFTIFQQTYFDKSVI